MWDWNYLLPEYLTELFKRYNHLGLVLLAAAFVCVCVFTRICRSISSWGSFNNFFLGICPLHLSFQFIVIWLLWLCSFHSLYHSLLSSEFCDCIVLFKEPTFGSVFHIHFTFVFCFIDFSFIFISYLLHALSLFYFPFSDVLSWKLGSLILNFSLLYMNI